MASILIIEDEAPIQLLLRRIIGGAGHDVTPAVDAATAWEALRQHAFDVIFTDLTLPGGPPGQDLLAGLAQRAPGSTIVVVSGHLPSDVQGLCSQLGIAHFLAKPFDLSSVRKLLNTVIAERAAKPS